MSADDKPADAGRADIDALERRLEKALSEIRRMLAEIQVEDRASPEDQREPAVATVH
jgi:hypothetical protein